MRLLFVALLSLVIMQADKKPAVKSPAVTTEQRLKVSEFRVKEYQLDNAIKTRQLEIVQLQQQLISTDKEMLEYTAGLCKADGWKFDITKTDCIAEDKKNAPAK